MAQNRLIHEKSPYLRQHAENPVDWYPWGEEAFAKAKELDRPILLSIGYSTCHYCHLMEKETFSQKVVADCLNSHFISIKVDREELPEVDSLYMEFASALSPQGVGWPLNVMLTSDLKPFLAVSYLPLKGAHGMVGFQEFIEEIARIWKGDERVALLEQGDKIVELFKNIHHVHSEDLPTEEDVFKGLEAILALADPLYGGMKGAPKFPLGEQLLFLLEVATTKNESRALYYVEKSLEMMSRGGIRDVLGGGFSRYSVDERWMVPHFEKMIYDNALLLEAYASYYALSRDEKYARVAHEIGDYLIRRMSEPGLAFFTAEDADSEGEEGRFYTWRYEEIYSLLPIEEAKLFCDFYNVKKEGNFKGNSILFQMESYEEFAKNRHLDVDSLKKSLESARAKLFEEREKRPKPFRDDKVLAGWNGLVIAALAKASGFLNRPDFLEKAYEAMDYLLNHHCHEGRVLRTTLGGESGSQGVLDDYAFMIRALITLFEMGGDFKWLKKALELCDFLDQKFRSPDGSYYSTEEKDSVLVRRSEFYDGTLPSGNGIHAENLVRLFQLLKNPDYLTKAEGILRASKGYIEAFFHGSATLLKALNRLYNTEASLLVVTLDDKRTHEQEVKGLFFSEYRPHTSLIFLGDELTKSLSGFEDSKTMDGKTTFYFCTQRGCLEPTTSFDKLKEALAVD